MFKRKKLWVLVLLAVVGGYLYLNMGGYVTRAAERIASGALGVAVNIGSIDVSWGEKKVTVSGLKIANPPGYQGAHIMTAEKLVIGLNTASKKLIDFKDIRVIGSEVYVEVSEKGMNLADLKALAAGKKQQDSVGSEQIRVIVRQMVVDASVIHTRIAMLGRDIPAIKMPAITLSGIGQGGGAPAGDAVTQLLGKYLTAVEKQARAEGVLSGASGVMGEVEKRLEGASGGLKGLFK